jgi:hypothetical protein
MGYFVLGAWLIQASVGVALLVGWFRSGRVAPVQMVAAHVALGVAGLGLWLLFLIDSNIAAAWLAFLLITVGNGLGDGMLIRRWRRMSGSTSGLWSAYREILRAAFHRKLPKRVVFHSLFSGVVYFSCLGVCIGATIAR